MPSNPDLQARSAPPGEDDQIPRQGWLELVPRRSLWKALAMLLLLVFIVYLQRRADVVVRQLGEIAPAPPAAGSPASSPSTSAGPARTK